MTDVDLDRLADFLGGALDGTLDEAEVRGLVAAEPAWTAALDQLSAASAAVGRDLLVLSEAACDPMPADVLTRLDAALTEAGALVAPLATAPEETVASEGPSTRQTQPERPVVAVVGQRRPGTPRHGAQGRSERRWGGRRWAPRALSVAAAVVVIGVGLVVGLPQLANNANDSKSTAADHALSTSGSAPVAGGPPVNPTLLASGTDYSQSTVTSVIAAAQNPAATGSGPQSLRAQRSGATGDSKAAGDAPNAPSAATAMEGAAGGPPAELARLADQAALSGCLSAVVKQHGGQVSVVDYAHFEGRAALVVVLVGTAETPGRRLVVVVGPECGQQGGNSDERYAAAG